MIAMVMCAGEGTRLRPLTYVLPKPMMPILNRPVLEYTLLNLKKYGIREAVINLSYKPRPIIDYFQDGSKMGMKIHYSIEKKMLGTAGGVKNVESLIRKDPDSEFLVTSGDGLTDINFAQLIDFHRQKKSLGTIALQSADSRFEYGVTLLNKDGRVRRFIEKPSWSDVYSCLVNTGIYVFNKEIFGHIPARRFYDFGKQVWPELLQKKKRVFGYEFKDFWTDIGNIAEYRRANRVAMDKMKSRVWKGERSKVHSSVKVIAPCFIGNDCVIEKNATIGPYSVIGNGSRVLARSILSNSILWEGSTLPCEFRLENTVLAAKSPLGQPVAACDASIVD